MNLLFRVLYAHGCTSTHHKLAMDALCHLRGASAEKWRNLFLKHHAEYLEGAKAPDTKFKDFRNHVLHVRDDYWGGAPATAAQWYTKTVAALQERDWSIAVYSAGVLSHYYTDPFMPFHTAQSEAENNIHRAAEWSITKSYDVLRGLLETRLGYPDVSVPVRRDWLEEMVKHGARLANPSYETLIQHYDFARGVKDPPRGLDDVSRELLARLIGEAIVGYARILDRAFDDANVEPPAVSLSVQGFLAGLQIPIKWVTSKMADAKERATVEVMYQELQMTGKVEKTLPADDRAVRELHRQEVLSAKPQATREPTAGPSVLPMPKPKQPAAKPASAPPPAVKPISVASAVVKPISAVPPTASVRPLKFYLEPSSPVADGPSIGPKTETRLNALGVKTVADLLAQNANSLATKLDQRSVTQQTVLDWQDQARLACQIPQIRGHDAQILVACGHRTVESVARASSSELLKQANQFVATVEGQRILRGSSPPDLEEVTDWISWAGQARGLQAA